LFTDAISGNFVGMKVFPTISDTQNAIKAFRKNSKSIGFVPTMGALHKGHLELMKRAKDENDILVVSIFVNPIQFNNKEDLEKYPRNLEKDKKLLEEVQCDVLFTPSAKEMYPEPVSESYDFGPLERVMEGAFRPEHFKGVAIVVKRLFDIFKPDNAYFGEKDYQQLAIVRRLVKKENLPITIIPCPTVRESDGLAMSSRNARLTHEGRILAPFIYQSLLDAKENMKNMTPEEVKFRLLNQFADQQKFRLEYFEIVDDKDLQPVSSWTETNGIRGFIAVYLGGVRLIDNIRFI
jgi:pantoate--beta-alanine ligase